MPIFMCISEKVAFLHGFYSWQNIHSFSFSLFLISFFFSTFSSLFSPFIFLSCADLFSPPCFSFTSSSYLSNSHSPVFLIFLSFFFPIFEVKFSSFLHLKCFFFHDWGCVQDVFTQPDAIPVMGDQNERCHCWVAIDRHNLL